jgi:hypothetical protein
MLIINPGTEARTGRTSDQAEKIVDGICQRLCLPRAMVALAGSADGESDGYFEYVYTNADGRKQLWDVPGDDAESFFKSVPFESARMYVDGSSWLWGYASGFISDFAACKYDE